MKREKTIKAAEEYANSIAQHEHDKNYCIKDFIAGAEWADAHPNWISVEDALPKDSCYILVASRGIVLHWRYVVLESADVLKNMYGITHWMPLPAPPKSSCSEIPTNCQSVTPSNQSKGDKK